MTAGNVDVGTRYSGDRVALGATARADQAAPKNPIKKALFREEKGLENWRARQDSNLWPSAPEADALSS